MKCFKVIYCAAALSMLMFVQISNSSPGSHVPTPYLTNPRVYRHARHKREISSRETDEGSLKHFDRLEVIIDIYGREQILDLVLNRELIPDNYFEKHQEDGQYSIKRPKTEEVELCHYRGHVRGISNSWVAVSTCSGIRGIIHNGSELYHIDILSKNKLTNSLMDTHVIFKHSDLRSNFTCGSTSETHFISATHKRVRRNTETIRGPYNANRLSRYVEFVLVADNSEYRALNGDASEVIQRCRDLVNIVNSVYEPLNIFVALVGVVIWTKRDEIDVNLDADETLHNFLKYRREILLKYHPNDNAQLLTKLRFNGNVVGRAELGSMCTLAGSGGVIVDHNDFIGIVALTIAHEMGHNFEMKHDIEVPGCHCPGVGCVMAESASPSNTEWSFCSKKSLADAFEHGLDYCLRNKPTRLFESQPVCGNGFVELGEQCDCGFEDKCDNLCCDATTCMLRANASCATGECCDLQTCELRPTGTVCRTAEHECDLPEYCNGQIEYCPEDVFKINGQSCENGKAFCYRGNCKSQDDQCQLLWGWSIKSSDKQCYEENTKGDESWNCGFDVWNQSYMKCAHADEQCGRLQCNLDVQESELQFGGRYYVLAMKYKILPGQNSKGYSKLLCRTVTIDLGLSDVDPGLVPNGAKCGENMMCLNQKCIAVDNFLMACQHSCNGNGICNSKGHCHCNEGFAPPYCNTSGFGGNEDSGPPAENPTDQSNGTPVILGAMLMVILLTVALLSYACYTRTISSSFWKTNARRTKYASFIACCNCNRRDYFNSTRRNRISSLPKWFCKVNDDGPSMERTNRGNTVLPKNKIAGGMNAPRINRRITIEHLDFKGETEIHNTDRIREHTTGTGLMRDLANDNRLGASSTIKCSMKGNSFRKNDSPSAVSKTNDVDAGALTKSITVGEKSRPGINGRIIMEHPHSKDVTVVRSMDRISDHATRSGLMRNPVDDGLFATRLTADRKPNENMFGKSVPPALPVRETKGVVDWRNKVISSNQKKNTTHFKQMNEDDQRNEIILLSHQKNVATLKQMFDRK